MSNDYIAPIVAKLTYNGASNLAGTIEHPDPTYPLSVNGHHRLYTGSGKWTHLAALGVERHLTSLGLAETVIVKPTKWDQGSEMFYITPLGREVAEYLVANWNSLALTFRDGRKNP